MEIDKNIFSHFDYKMNSIIKESVHRVYHKFNQFTKNGFHKIHKFLKKK